MPRFFLREAAASVGISEEQAMEFIRAIREPCCGLTQYADDNAPIPPFKWPPNRGQEFEEIFRGWSGLTRGEYNNSRAAEIWRAMCDGLLYQDTDVWWWEKELWSLPNPSTVTKR